MGKHKIALVAVLAMVSSLGFGSGQAWASATIAPSSTSISSDSATGSSVALPAIMVTEGAAGDIQVGTLTLALPTGYMFDTGSIANVAYTGTGLAGSSTVSFPDNMHASLTITATSTAAGSFTIGGTTPLKVKASAGTPLAPAGSIMLSAGTITGLSATTTLGTLTQIAGGATKLAFTVQPPTTVVAGTTFGATITVQDQFGNTVTNENNRPITLTSTNASSTLSGTTTVNDTAGISAFTNLSVGTAGTLQLSATSTSLASALSNAITITATTPPTTTPPTTTPPMLGCGLQNGMLVKIGDSPTIFMVVNCILRPFDSAAIFHAKGKKFQDVRDIDGNEHQYGIGRPIGQGNDDDSTIVIPPSATGTPISLTGTTTPPSLANLPDGSVVKIPGNPTVYLVSGGVLQPFTSATIFNLHHKSFNQIQTITQTQFSQMSLGNPVTPPDGTLLKGSNHTVYVVQGGQLYGIPSMTVLNKHGWSLKNLLQLSDGEMNSLSHGGVQN